MAIWRRTSGDTPAVLALVKADIAESLVKRLTMVVLSAKAKLRVTQSRVWGVSASVAGGVDASLDGTDFPPSLAAALPAPALSVTVLHGPVGQWVSAPRTDHT